MKLTMTQQILAKKLGMTYEEAVTALSAGTLTLVEVDTALSNRAGSNRRLQQERR